jgi:hypothetical protein
MIGLPLDQARGIAERMRVERGLHDRAVDGELDLDLTEIDRTPIGDRGADHEGAVRIGICKHFGRAEPGPVAEAAGDHFDQRHELDRGRDLVVAMILARQIAQDAKGEFDFERQPMIQSGLQRHARLENHAARHRRTARLGIGAARPDLPAADRAERRHDLVLDGVGIGDRRRAKRFRQPVDRSAAAMRLDQKMRSFAGDRHVIVL